MTSATYEVTGMTCKHCVRTVTGALQSVSGVTDVTIGLVPGGQSTVTVTSEAPLSREAMTAALNEAGGYRLAGD